MAVSTNPHFKDIEASNKWIVKEIRKAETHNDLSLSARWISLLKQQCNEEEYLFLKKEFGSQYDWCHICDFYHRLYKLPKLPTTSTAIRAQGWSRLIDDQDDDVHLRLYQGKRQEGYSMSFYLSAEVLASDIPIMTIIALAGELESSVTLFQKVFRSYYEYNDEATQRAFVLGLRSPLPLVVAHRDVAMNVLFSNGTDPATESRSLKRADKHALQLPAESGETKECEEAWWRGSLVHFFGESFASINACECRKENNASPCNRCATNERGGRLLAQIAHKTRAVQHSGNCDVLKLQGIVNVSHHPTLNRMVPRIDFVVEVDPNLGFTIPTWFVKLASKLVWKTIVTRYATLCRWIQKRDTDNMDGMLITAYHNAMNTNPLYKWINERVKQALEH